MRHQDWIYLQNEHTAEALYQRAYRLGLLAQLVAAIRRQPRRLLSLEGAVAGRAVTRGVAQAIGPVVLAHVRGSVRPDTRYDRKLRPLTWGLAQPWRRVASAMLRGERLPPIELIQFGDAYFVRDGHLRVSAARALGVEQLDAVVSVWRLHEPCVAGAAAGLAHQEPRRADAACVAGTC